MSYVSGRANSKARLRTIVTLVVASTLTTAIGVLLGCFAGRGVQDLLRAIKRVGHGDTIER
jgi:hypothetical protein